jgi:CheY-like chemotaxis protein
LDIFGFVLQAKDAEVFATVSTAEAIDKASVWYPDVLICDVSLPGQNGYALLNELRGFQTDPSRNLATIAVTTLFRQQDYLKLYSQHLQSEDFQKYLPKPTDVDELVRVVAELARRIPQQMGCK